MEETNHLIAFLNAVLDAKDQQRLISLEIINNKELTAEMIYDKTSRLDVWAKTNPLQISPDQTQQPEHPAPDSV
jgi:hypothetical protein